MNFTRRFNAMELRDREFFTYRIGLGYIKYEEKDIILYIHEPTLEELYDAQEQYRKAYQDAIFNKIYTDEEMLEIMRDKGLWSDKEDAKLKGLPKEMEELKLKMYENVLRPDKVKNIRKHLRQVEKQYQDVAAKRYIFEPSTCEGYASYVRTTWKIEHCTRMKDGSACDWSAMNFNEIMSHYHENKLSETDLREIAKTEPFRSIWHGGRKKVFNRSGLELTYEQKSLVMWSGLYDSLNESPECPTDNVIQDDDLLDGWLTQQRRERESDRKKRAGEKYDMEADDIFIPAKTPEEVENIQGLNDQGNDAVVKARHAQIQEVGEVKHADLIDVKRDLMMQANEQQASSSKR